jgi:hypothetical protein
MSWLLAIALLTGAKDPGVRPPVTRAGHCAPLAVRCRWECVCFRESGYRCRRYYTEACSGRACWQCQAAVTERARKSCAIGSPVKSCWCKFTRQ